MQSILKEKNSLWGDIRRLMAEPPLFITIVVIMALFALFIVYPLIKIITIPEAGDWLTGITTTLFQDAFKNTLMMTLLSTTTAVTLAFFYAYAIHYANIPGKSFFRSIILLPLMAPSVVTGLAFIMLFGRRGLITFHLLGLKVNLYGLPGLWIVQTMAFFPLAYLTISAVLRAIAPNLEVAAQNLGAKGFRLFRSVTLPLALPGVMSAFLLVSINTLADFGNPMLVGGGLKLLATEAYVQVTALWNMPMASVLSVFLLLPTLGVFLLQKYVLDKRSFVTVTGKPVSGLKRIEISPLIRTLLFILCSCVALFILMIFGVVACFALTNTFGINNSLTFNHFQDVLFNSKAMVNSWTLSLSSAGIVTVLGVLTAFLVTRKKFPGKAIIDFIAVLPISMPGTFMGLALILAFNAGWLSLTGTATIIIIGLVMRQLPVGYRNAIAGFKQIDKSIEEASTNLGANSVNTFRRIVMPMLKNAISTSFVYSFIKSMNTLSTVIFLVSPQWPLAAISILSLADHGYYGKASATALMMMVSIIGTLLIVKLIFRNKMNIFNL